MYELEKHFGYNIYLCFVYLLKYEIIILKGHLVTKSKLLVQRNQTSFLMKLSTSSLVLVRVY